MVRWLVDDDRADEITVVTHLVLVSRGTRLFVATGPGEALEPVNFQSTPKGGSIQVHPPTGRRQYATASPGLDHETQKPPGGDPPGGWH